jgi:hypothetical protein
VNTVPPRFSTSENIQIIKVPAGETFSGICAAQSSPAPIFKQVLFYFSKILLNLFFIPELLNTLNDSFHFIEPRLISSAKSDP